MSEPTVTAVELAYCLLAVLEGVKLRAYQDSGGVWTNGIGNTHNVIPGSVITDEQSRADFYCNVAPLLPLVSDRPVIVAAALISFGHNCGRDKLIKVLAGADSISNPVHTTDRHGNVQNGLISRRNLEACMVRLG